MVKSETIKRHALDKNNWTFAALIAVSAMFINEIRDLRDEVCDYEAKCQTYVVECKSALEKCALKMCLLETGDFEACE